MKLTFAWKLPSGNLAIRSDGLLVLPYRTSKPVTARPMIMRWISEVPSKIVKLLGLAACHQDLCSRLCA
jgi:hypothetical protein